MRLVTIHTLTSGTKMAVFEREGERVSLIVGPKAPRDAMFHFLQKQHGKDWRQHYNSEAQQAVYQCLESFSTTTQTPDC